MLAAETETGGMAPLTVQENAFKEAAAAVAFEQHRGNCGRVVDNIEVITEVRGSGRARSLMARRSPASPATPPRSR